MIRVLFYIALSFLCGCATLKPWQNAFHGKPAMIRGFGLSGLFDDYNQKLFEVKTAGGLPGSAPGGGCGCSQ